jgi:putative CocE/NonD family hydrolase
MGERSGEVRATYDVRVQMRDGVELATDLWRPVAREPVHVVLARTPYNKNNAQVARMGRVFSSHGFAFAMLDVRGRGDSGGTFTPYANDAQDGVDAIAWLAAQDWCSGKVATIGGSYDGLVQWLTALHRPPALAAMIAMVSPSDPFVEFPTGTCVPMMVSWHRLTAGRVRQHVDDVDWERVYRHLPLMTMDQAAGFVSEHWREAQRHPTLDAHHEPLRYQDRLADLDVPVLHISGWYDDEQVGTPRNFAGMVAGGAAGQQLLMGPWGHAVNTTRTLGEVDFGPSALIDLDGYWLRWLDAQLDHKPWPDKPVRIFVMGVDEWRDHDVWPPAAMEPRPLYLRSDGGANSRLGNGRLSWERPPEDEPPDRYEYSPERPVPFLTEQKSAQLGGPDDYSAVELRGDVLVYTGEPLERPLELVGPVRLVLHATSSALDTDFVGRLLDVHPSGFAQRLCDGIVRARFRSGFDAERLLEPGVAVEYDIDLWHTAHVFLPRHRLRVEVTSSAFPKYDRNLNTGEPLATSTRMVTATQSVHHDAPRPSHLLCPVVPHEC